MMTKKKLFVGLITLVMGFNQLPVRKNTAYDINLANYSHYAYAGDESGEIGNEQDPIYDPYSLIGLFNKTMVLMGFK